MFSLQTITLNCAKQLQPSGSGSRSYFSRFRFCWHTIWFSLLPDNCFFFMQRIFARRENMKRPNYHLSWLYRKRKKVMNLPRSMKVLLHYRKPVFTYKKRCKVWIWRCRVVMTKHLVGVGEKPQEQPMYFQRDKKERKKKKDMTICSCWVTTERLRLYVKVILVL